MKTAVWLAATTALAVVSGCAGTPQVQPPNSDITLGDAFVAVTISPQTSGELQPTTRKGSLVLVSPDGSTKIIEVSKMESGQVDWRGDYVAFSDTDNDYLLSDELVTIPSKTKTDYQQALRVSENGVITALYNEGFDDDGYIQQVVISSEDGAISTDVEGAYRSTAYCNENLYGVAEPSGKYLLQANRNGIELGNEDGYTSQMFNRLTHNRRADLKNLAIKEVNSSAHDSTDAPCAQGAMWHLVDVYVDDALTIPALRSWSLTTGSMKELKLVDEFGNSVVDPGGEYVDRRGASAASIRGNQLDWVDDFGHTWSSNIDTGVTTELFDLSGDYDNTQDDRVINFTERSLTVVTFHRAEAQARLVRYDRDTGDILADLELPAVAKLLDDQTLWDVAAKPD